MAHPLNVLIVEDNIINQKVVMKMLERLGCSAGVAQNGREGVDQFRSGSFDLIFMDMQMPEMDGLEATKAIRALGEKGSSVIIIALTANAMAGDRERCLAAGMNDYLAKPVKQTDIEAVIRQWFPAALMRSEDNGPPPAPFTPFDPVRLRQIEEIGDAGLLKELMQLYLQDLEQYLEQIDDAITRTDFRLAYESSHKLKGSSANLGVDRVREACLAMETCARQEDAAGMEQQAKTMTAIITELRDYIVIAYR